MKLRSTEFCQGESIFRWQNLNALKARQLKVHRIDQYSFTNIYKLYKKVVFKYPSSSWRTLSCFIHKSMGIIFQSEIRSTCRLLLEISFKVGKLFPVSSFSSSELFFFFKLEIRSTSRILCKGSEYFAVSSYRVRKTLFVWKLERI